MKGFVIFMNKKLENFKDNIKGKKIDVLGIGISNIPLIKLLAKEGAKVHACDKREKEALGEVYDELKGLGVTFSLGDEYMDNLTGELIFKTPGMRFDHPKLLEAKKNGSTVTSEMELFCEFSPAKIIAITGSDGKTTTTTLISEILKKSGKKVWLGGNIGTPLFCSLDQIDKDDTVVLELSSFQLHTMRQSISVAVMTNISPNHLDMHKDYQEYIDAKKNIMLYQDSDSLLVVNEDNEKTREIGKEAKGRKLGFGWSADYDVYCDGEAIYKNGEKILAVSDIKIPGKHNIENYMAAIAAVSDIAKRDAIVSVAREFGGVEHRIELVRTVDGVRYYNSSIDSTPNRTINTLKVFPEKVILIAGGKDKGIPYDEIGPAIVESVKTLILVGATAGKIRDALSATDGHDAVEVFEFDEYADAVKCAKDSAKAGDVVLLSPASTSFDKFRNFEERGKLFKKLVNEL